MKSLALFLVTAFLSGCATTPQGVTPVENFELGRYLGTWYEIARLDHRFERGLSKVSATYSQRDDGGIDVLNRGWNERTGQWREARGRAYFIGAPDVAQLKVTFFWPFYGGYNVVELDRENYGYVLLCGPSRDYLWIMARSGRLDQTIVERLVARAKSLGFDTDGLIFVEH